MVLIRKSSLTWWSNVLVRQTNQVKGTIEYQGQEMNATMGSVVITNFRWTLITSMSTVSDPANTGVFNYNILSHFKNIHFISLISACFNFKSITVKNYYMF